MFPTGGLSFETLDLPIRDLPDRLTGLKLIQLSDFHAEGWSLSDRLLNQAIAASNREYPDLVLLTGDFVTYKPEAIHALAPKLEQLTSRYGVYAILGNHDLLETHSRSIITAALTQVGIRVLWNELCYPCGEGLALAGFGHQGMYHFLPDEVMAQIPENVPRLVLTHTPDCAEKLKPWRVDLQLAGHTHGGQIFIPGLGSLPAIATAFYDAIPNSLTSKIRILRKLKRIRVNWDWDRGLHTIDRRPYSNTPNRLYTNRGLGTYAPGRLFCPPEITRIRLHPAPIDRNLS